MSVWKTSRSEIIAYQRCPRMAWYSRFFNGTGIAKKRTSLPLAFGSAYHAGAEALLAGDVELAVVKAHNYLDLAFSAEAVDVEAAETVYAIAEQKAIVEGLIRGWWLHEGERFLRDFEVLEVEVEGEAELAPGMVFQFRPDAVVRERQSGDLYIVSWKTASMAGKFTMDQASVDMQSMSEAWGVEQAYKKDDPDSSLRIEGILYLTVVKGQRKRDEFIGAYRQNSPLAYVWVRKGATDADTEYAHRYGWDTEEISEKTGKPVGTKLGKGFRLMPVWEAYPGGVKQWIEDLAAQRIAPRHINALDSIFPQSLPVSRRADEIESWRRQVWKQEEWTANTASIMMDAQDGADPNFDAMLDDYFPQHTHSCLSYNSRCQFWDCCWNPAVKADPIGSGLYQIATKNHPSGDADADD